MQFTFMSALLVLLIPINCTVIHRRLMIIARQLKMNVKNSHDALVVVNAVTSWPTASAGMLLFS